MKTFYISFCNMINIKFLFLFIGQWKCKPHRLQEIFQNILTTKVPGKDGACKVGRAWIQNVCI